MKHIKYREGYKYQLAEDFSIKTEIIGYDIDIQFIKLTLVGVLTLKSGYASDGPSGPTFDTKDFMKGSFVHDGLYQLMRLSLIPQSYREYADKLLRKICIDDGMPEIRADYCFQFVDKFAAFAANPKNKKKVIIAP